MKPAKPLLRSVMRMLHPDLFNAHPDEQEANTNALKILNHYLDLLAQNSRPKPVTLRFWIRKQDDLKAISVDLDSDGSLAPLYYALGFITEEEKSLWTSNESDRQMDEDLLEWLATYVHKVVNDGEQHSILQSTISITKAELESKYRLHHLKVDEAFGMGVDDLKLQMDLIDVLDTEMEAFTKGKNLFEGLSICIYRSDRVPIDVVIHQSSKKKRRSWLTDDGTIHIVVEKETLMDTLRELNLERASSLTRIHAFWMRQALDLRQSMKDLLDIEEVLCDISTGTSTRNFVLWASHVLSHREEIQEKLKGKPMTIKLIVHSDETASVLDHCATTSTLHVRTDCSPMQFLDYLQSDQFLSVDDNARDMLTDDEEEKRILEKVRMALGAKQVIRICSIYERDHVIKAAEKLIEQAETIRQCVDLSETSIAIDNDYEAWETGFVSIPYNYHMTDLKPNLRKLIGSGKSPSQNKTNHRPFKAKTPTVSYLRSATNHRFCKFPKPIINRRGFLIQNLRFV